ncbi:hypothetical protein BJ322DRAFT_1007687 [Thelephora terrestris]|uniref:Uncharacterized protein n=1 Tax=Thelephora terrestris TaxID=56493 RepID=A0A9P6HBK2_9AGAM|nr:hypothetical protein BJ322DRAFT_1007687 [Thelephora terrestris]
MGHKRQNEDIGHPPDGSSKRVKNERHEGRLPTKAAAHGHGREDQSATRSQQVERLKDLENDKRRLSDAHQAVLAELRETHSTCEKQQQEISFLREKLRESSALLDIRNQELKVAKTFLSKEDPLSTSDIVQSVRDLNSEIMQIATHLADNLVLVRKHPAGNVPEGPCNPIFTALIWPRRPWDEVDEGSLELALQGFLVIWVSLIVNAWGFGEASGWCDQMYSKVRETEEPTVASNWRALTRRTLFNMDLSRSDLPSQIVNGAIEQLAFLLSSCGAGGFPENAHNIHKHAAGKLASLFVAARKLNKVVGENVVSGDLVVTLISGRCPFDADYMEAPYARGGAKPGQGYVICTTDLGLCERKGTKAEKILLKPKVTLDGF